MQNKHQKFFFWCGCPNLRWGGGGQAGWDKIPSLSKELFVRLPWRAKPITISIHMNPFLCYVHSKCHSLIWYKEIHRIGARVRPKIGREVAFIFLKQNMLSLMNKNFPYIHKISQFCLWFIILTRSSRLGQNPKFGKGKIFVAPLMHLLNFASSFIEMMIGNHNFTILFAC